MFKKRFHQSNLVMDRPKEGNKTKHVRGIFECNELGEIVKYFK